MIAAGSQLLPRNHIRVVRSDVDRRHVAVTFA